MMAATSLPVQTSTSNIRHLSCKRRRRQTACEEGIVGKRPVSFGGVSTVAEGLGRDTVVAERPCRGPASVFRQIPYETLLILVNM